MVEDNLLSREQVLTGPHKDFETIRKVGEDGVEYWEARELMVLMGYIEWRKFEQSIIRAQKSCVSSGQSIQDHFVGADKMIKIATGSKKEALRKVKNYHLSRYACYLVAQNGDSRKKEIALAQTYFAWQTRKQELFEAMDADGKRLYVRQEVISHNKKLFDTAKKAGVTNFGKFNNAGYLGLYGLDAQEIKEKKKIGNDDILDRAGSTELAANLFRITQTDEKIRKEDIQGEEKATVTHYHVGAKVRKTIKEIGGTMPEDLAPEEHIESVYHKKLGAKPVQKRLGKKK
jgi:DNA-damage-inducible protein D